ncbi:MAG TPA: hypothetical protein VH165_10015 [Kofleriaceae bacterium]|jgi:hypothetical protein|nr:hypothetical protein [Kofleriaceae bacterium]
MSIELRTLNEALRAAGPHQTRPIRFVRTEPISDWRVKLYTIATHGEVARPALLDEVLRRAPGVFPAPATAGGRHGLGFIIAHDAKTASIAIYYWWQSFNELHQRVYVGPKDDPRAMTQLAEQTAGCVWELEIVDFERRAWLADVLANPGGPDVERYLARHVDTEI